MGFGFFELPDRFVSAHLDGVAFGRPDSGALFKLGKFDGWFGAPGVRADKTDRLWGHGSFTERGWRDSRLLVLEGIARFLSEQAAVDAYDRITSMVAAGDYGDLTVTDSLFGVQSAKVRLANELVIDWLTPSIFKYQVQLLASDPRKYGQTISGSTGVAVAGGGLGFGLFATDMAPGVLDFGEPGSPGIVSLTNAGTADTPTVQTVIGDMPNGFTITERGTQRQLAYGDAVRPGQTVVLDSADGTVMLDGADRSTKLVRRQWVRLDKGQTGQWFFEAPGSTDAQLTVEVTPAWW